MDAADLTLPTDTTPRILAGDCLRVLRRLPADSIHCIVSSYPYWGLRDYGACSCAQERRASEGLREMGGNTTDANAGSWVQRAADPNCPLCGGTGRIEMETVWDEPAEPCAHEWETTFRYWDNRHAAALAEYGSDDLGSHQAVSRRVSSTFCSKCRAWKGAFGLEPSVGMYVVHATQISEELRRVLRPDGTFWLNLGDCYSGSGKGPEGGFKANGSEAGSAGGLARDRPLGLKPKDLVGVPWRVAFALQAAGWYLRCDVVWAKPNPMPESTRDRPSRSHEYVFLLTKRERYFYDAEAVRTPLPESSRKRYQHAVDTDEQYDPARHKHSDGVQVPMEVLTRAAANVLANGGANLKSVWPIPVKPYAEAHFATFPPDLVETCIKAGTSAAGACSVCGTPWAREVVAEGGTIGTDWHPDKGLEQGRVQGIVAEGAKDGTYRRRDLGFRPRCDHPEAAKVPCLVLDPFTGSGTTLYVARQLGRRSVGVELNPLYVKLAERRVGRFRDLLSYGDEAEGSG